MTDRDPYSGHRLFEVTPQQLRHVSVLSNLSDLELAEISQLCDGLLCLPGQCLVGRADHTRSVFFILEGRVKIVSYSSGNREVIFREMSAGDMLGELAAISGEPRSAGVWTIEKTRVARLSAECLWQLMSTDTAVMRAILQHLAKLVYALTERVFEHDSLKVESRIHSELLRLGRERGIENNSVVIDPAPTQADIGNLVGTTRRAANQELKKLEKAGIIKTSRQRITLLDVCALERLVDSGEHVGRYVSGELQDMKAPQKLTRGVRPNAAKSQSPELTRVKNAMSLWDQALRDRRQRDC